MLWRSDLQSDFSIFHLEAGEIAKRPPCTYIFSGLDAYKRNLAKQLCAFLESVWLLDPALEAFENIAACRNKGSQMRERILLAILRTQEYTRSRGSCLATDNHKYAK